MRLALEDFIAGQKALEERMAAFESQCQELKDRLSEERKLRKSAERKARTLWGQASESQEKDDFDGTEGTLRTDSVDNNRCNGALDL